MYEGFLDNYRSWTYETRTIMHYWIQRQYQDNNGQYRGNFKLLVQMGENKLILSKSFNTYIVRMNETRNPMINYELLRSACELVLISIDELKQKMNKGRFLVLSDSIQPIMDPNGVDIIIDDIADIHIDVGKVIIRDDEKEGRFLIIYDTDGYQIMVLISSLMT